MYYSRGTQNASSIIGKIDHFAYILFNCLTRRLDVLSISMLFVGFVTSALFTYKLPEVRVIAVLIVALVLCTSIANNIKKKRIDFIFQSVLLIFIVFQLLLDQARAYPSNIAPFIAIFIAFSFYRYNNLIYKFLRLVIVINFFVMMYELFNYDYLIQVVEGVKYESGRLQGLFSYSKECGFFLLITFLYVRSYQAGLFVHSIILASSLMSGSRTVILFVAFVILFDLILSFRVKFKINDFYRTIAIMTFGGVIFAYLAAKYFDHNNLYMFYRILDSFNFSSSSHVDRFFYWASYIYGMENYTLAQWIFGAGTYQNHLIGNGSENTYLMILSQSGLSGLAIFTFPFLISIFLFFRSPKELYPLVLVFVFLNVGRIGVGWSDGILMWCYIFGVIYSRSNVLGNKCETVGGQ